MMRYAALVIAASVMVAACDVGAPTDALEEPVRAEVKLHGTSPTGMPTLLVIIDGVRHTSDELPPDFSLTSEEIEEVKVLRGSVARKFTEPDPVDGVVIVRTKKADSEEGKEGGR